MPFESRNRRNHGVRFAIMTDRLRKRLRPKGRRAATYLLGAALGLGGVGEAYRDIEAGRQIRLSQVATDAQASATVAAPVADESSSSERNLTVEIHPLIRAEWLPENPSAPLVGEQVRIINAGIRESFFRSAIPYGDLIHEKSRKYDVDPLLVAAVVQAESSFRPKAVSPRGARGLMQLMPKTGRWMGAKNLTDPAQNIDAGVRYLKYLEKRFDGNRELQIAAYNAGEGNVQRYRGVPPFRETRAYVRKVNTNYERQKSRMERFEKQQEVAAR